jgi:hypothetical protein
MGLSKYDWGAACRACMTFRDSPGAVRVAWEICERYNEKVGIAWPTRETLAQALDAPPESISKWIAMLRDSKAIKCVSLGTLAPEKRLAVGRIARRSQVYELNFEWAARVLEHRDERAVERQEAIRQKVTTPPPFDPEDNGSATPKGNDAATSKGNGAATLIPYPETLDHTLKEKGASDGSNLSAYARECSAKAKGRAA